MSLSPIFKVYTKDFFETEAFKSRRLHTVKFARDSIVLREGGAFCLDVEVSLCLVEGGVEFG